MTVGIESSGIVWLVEGYSPVKISGEGKWCWSSKERGLVAKGEGTSPSRDERRSAMVDWVDVMALGGECSRTCFVGRGLS